MIFVASKLKLMNVYSSRKFSKNTSLSYCIPPSSSMHSLRKLPPGRKDHIPEAKTFFWTHQISVENKDAPSTHFEAAKFGKDSK